MFPLWYESWSSQVFIQLREPEHMSWHVGVWSEICFHLHPHLFLHLHLLHPKTTLPTSTIWVLLCGDASREVCVDMGLLMWRCLPNVWNRKSELELEKREINESRRKSRLNRSWINSRTISFLLDRSHLLARVRTLDLEPSNELLIRYNSALVRSTTTAQTLP